jgi:L-iditol 2-dehydrogenase
MKALLLSEYNHLEVKDLPAPIPDPDEILIEVSACGICGSDVHGYDGSTGRRIPPIVMGHEAAGTVVAVGSEVDDFKPGDRVTFDSTVYCGTCEYCLKGEVNLCDQRQVIGVSCKEFRRPGAFAEFLTVPARIAYRLPDSFSFPQAAMLEAVSVALHGVAVSEMKGGETVLVIGAGMIGLLLLQAARAAGCSHIFICDVDATRLAMAEKLGAHRTILASGDALTEEILRETGGNGVDVVLEAVGRHRLHTQGWNRNAGRQHLAPNHASFTKGRLSPDPSAGLVRFGWGIPTGDRSDRKWKDQGRCFDHGSRAVERRSIMVRASTRP